MRSSNDRRIDTSYLSTLLLLGVLILPFALITVANQNLDDYDSMVRSRLYMELYLQNGLSDAQLQTLMKELTTLPGYMNHEFRDRASAYRELQTSLGIGPFPENVTNPLPDAIEIRFSPEFSTSADFQKVVSLLKVRSEIESINYGSNSLIQNERALSLAERTLDALRLVACAISTVLIYFFMRKTIQSDKRHFELLKLLGSGWKSTALPFIVRKTTLGTVATILSFAALFACISVLQSWSIELNQASTQSLLLILGFGVVSSLLSATVAVSSEL